MEGNNVGEGRDDVEEDDDDSRLDVVIGLSRVGGRQH